MYYVIRILNTVIFILLYSNTVFTQVEIPPTLEAGKPVERELKGGEIHNYQIKLVAGQFLYVVADQRGIDVAVTLYAPDGNKLFEIDSPNGTKGEEPLKFVSETDGNYLIEIKSLEKNAPGGRYELKIVEQRVSTPQDISIIKARQAIAQGDNLRGQNNAEAYRKALEKYQEAVSLYQQTDDISGLGRALSSNGLAYQNLLQLDLALEFQEKSLELFEQTGEKRSIELILNFIAQLYQDMGNYPKAIEFFKRATLLDLELGDKRQLHGRLLNIGILYSFQGDFIQALTFYEKSLIVAKELGRKGTIGSSLINIGTIYVKQGNYALAMENFQQALTLFEEAGAKSGIVIAQENIGNLLYQQNDLPKALEHFQKSLKGAEALGKKEFIANQLKHLGRIYFEQGNNQLALDYFQKSLNLIEEDLSNIESLHDRSQIAGLLRSMSEVYAAVGDYAKAIQSAEKASSLLRNANHYESLWPVLSVLGHYYRQVKQDAMAQKAFEEAIATIENLRFLVAGGEQQEQSFLNDKTSPYTGMMELMLTKGKMVEALSFVERTKSRTLLDVLQNGKTDFTKAMSSQEQEQERRFKAEFVSLNTWISIENQTQQSNKTRLADLQNQLQKKRLEFEDFQTRLYLTHPELKVQRGEIKPVSLEETAELMPDEKTAIAEYVVAGDKTFLFVITKDASKKVSLKSFTVDVTDEKLGNLVEAYRSKLASGDLDFQNASRSLYDLLLKPAQAHISGKSNLIFVPGGPLWNLPFQALLNGRNKYLVEQASISYAPSLTALRAMSKKAGAKKRNTDLELVAFGNPIIAKATTDRIKQVFMGETLEPLPESERLVKELGKMYGPNRSRSYVGDQAREETAKAESPKYRIVQFATHGILNNISPMYSYLVLSQDEKNRNEDGLLEAWEMKDLDLKADMVILSACETARGRISNGEGVIGMSWALFIAGTPTTVASQWKVESSSTTELMLEFHRQLLTGKNISKAEALRRASLKLLKTPKYKHPSYWAGFVIVGDGS